VINLNICSYYQDSGINATTWDMYDTFQQLAKETKGSLTYNRFLFQTLRADLSLRTIVRH